ncbi:hypothetical protein O6H91_Y510300 [Diphasiastrum complanatum]|nr:hypothetical protein O6H91_Y510300 [Diphasiastrum complanatum]
MEVLQVQVHGNLFSGGLVPAAATSVNKFRETASWRCNGGFLPGQRKDARNVKSPLLGLHVRQIYRPAGAPPVRCCSLQEPAIFPSQSDGYGGQVCILASSVISRCKPPSSFGTVTSGAILDEELTLKTKAQEVAKDLKGTCIFLIGMMGSGKSTIGRILSEALGYYFFDSDKVVEQLAGGATVAQLFAEGKEEWFRDAESEVLSQLSAMCRLVVATGGGAVVRPNNWGYLRHGIVVWLNVPLEALAHRVVQAGTETRPLLGKADMDSAYSQAYAQLSKLLEERGQAYANADTTVSFQDLAVDLGTDDVAALTPTIIAIQVLEEIQKLLKQQKKSRQMRHF